MNHALYPTQPYVTGDHVWWGDPSMPEMGIIIGFSRNDKIAYIHIQRMNPMKDGYTSYPRIQLKPRCPICGAIIPQSGDVCPNDCL